MSTSNLSLLRPCSGMAGLRRRLQIVVIIIIINYYYYYYVMFYSNIRLSYRDIPDIQLTTTKLGSQSNSLIQLILSFHALCNMHEAIALPTVSMTGGSP